MDRNTHQQILSELLGRDIKDFPSHYAKFTGQITADAGARLGFAPQGSIPITMTNKTTVHA